MKTCLTEHERRQAWRTQPSELKFPHDVSVGAPLLPLSTCTEYKIGAVGNLKCTHSAVRVPPKLRRITSVYGQPLLRYGAGCDDMHETLLRVTKSAPITQKRTIASNLIKRHRPLTFRKTR